MKNLQRPFTALSLFGWLSSLCFLLYAQGLFAAFYSWSMMDFQMGVPILAFASVIFSIPYLILGFLRWNFPRLAPFLLVITGIMIAVSLHAYYSAYISRPPEEGSEWLFLIVPFCQSVFAIALTIVVPIGEIFRQFWVHLRKTKFSKPSNS